MILLWLVLTPALAAGLAWVLPARSRTGILLGTAMLHAALVASLWAAPGHRVFDGWLADDAIGRIILTLVSGLFVALAHYAVGYLREENPRGARTFATCMLGFLAAASLVSLSHHFVLLWIGMGTTTLAVAPMIFHRHDRRSLEAVWKYLVLSSVGIAFALLGVFFLATAQPVGAGRPLVLEDLVAGAASLNRTWLRAAFTFLLIGFGTKMGLAPLHAWKPDVYGEAPSVVGGLMAGALTSCAFLGLARVVAIANAAGDGAFVRPPLVAFGLLSMLVATAFIIVQGDVKRLLGYSSIEHMGLLVVALGLGGLGTYGAMLHVVNNAAAKVLVFLAVGNVVLATGTSVAGRIRGLARDMPASAALLVIGLFAVTGAPPFGMFLSEFVIVRAAIETMPWVAVALLVLLAIIFVGIAAMVLEMVYGDADGPRAARVRPWLVVAPAALAVVVLLLGVWMPPPLSRALAGAALALGGHGP